MLHRRRGRQLFRDIELLVIDGICSRASPDTRNALEEQVAGARFVQRLIGATEINIYHARRGETPPPGLPRLPFADEERIIARIDLSHPRLDTPLRCNVWAVKAVLFSLEFNAATKQLRASEARVLRVELDQEEQPHRTVLEDDDR